MAMFECGGEAGMALPLFPLLPSALLPPLPPNNPIFDFPPRPVLEAPFFLGRGPRYSSIISSSDSESDSDDFIRLDVWASEIFFKKSENKCLY